MIEQVASAFEKKDYRTAAKLLKQLLKESQRNPQVQLYKKYPGSSNKQKKFFVNFYVSVLTTK